MEAMEAMDIESKFVKAYTNIIRDWRDMIHLSGTELIEAIIEGLNEHAIAEADQSICCPHPTGPLPVESLNLKAIKLSMTKLLEQLHVFQYVDMEDCMEDCSEKLYEHTFLVENPGEFLQDPILKNLSKQFDLMVCHHYYRYSEIRY